MLVELKEICEFQEGYVNPAQTHNEYFDGYIKWIRATDINNTYIYNTSRTLTDIGFKSAGKSAKLFEPNTLIISKSGTIGKLGILKDFMCGNRAVINIKPILSKVNMMYLYYSIKMKLPYIKELARGSVQKNLYIFMLEKVKIFLPDLKTQEKMIKLLEYIDKKIELNNEINNNLFELVLNDFNDFLNKNADSEMIKLEDCVEKINTGADAIQRAPIVDYDTGIRCIRIGDMTNSRDYHSWGFTKMTDKDFENYKLIRNDIVITRTAVNGLTYMITDEENIVCNNGNIRLRVNNKYNPLYIYLNTKTKDFRNYIDRINSETSVRPNMKVEYFTSYEIKKIDLDKQNDFCVRAESIMKKIQNKKVENYNLEQLRDTLLPKLMNGEIDLDNIEI